MARQVAGANAARLRELVNKQAFGVAGSWPSEDRHGVEIEGSIGTTSIRDLETGGSYLIEGREEALISAGLGSPGQSELTGLERAELVTINASATQVSRA